MKGIHSWKYDALNDVVYFHVLIANNTNISFGVDCCYFIVADYKADKRMNQHQRSIFTFPK